MMQQKMSEKMSLKLACSVAALVAASGAASAIPVFSNLGANPASGHSVSEQSSMIVDDLVLAGGGELASLKFSMNYSGGGFGVPPAINLGADVHLFLDDGDGVPQIVGGPDTLLWSGRVEQSRFALGEEKRPELAIAPGIHVSAGDRLWLAVQYDHDAFGLVNFGTTLYSEFALGSSDDFVYTVDANTGFTQSFFFEGYGVGAHLTVVPAPAALTPLAVGGLILMRRRR